MDKKIVRIRKLIFYLLDRKEIVTAKELADYLNVSQKTIYRLVREINEHNRNKPLIESHKGIGYRLNYSNYIELDSQLLKVDQSSPKLRQQNILKDLLSASPNSIPIYKLYEKYYVSDSVISTDSYEIQKYISQFNLNLVRNQGLLSIEGSESDIRKIIEQVYKRYSVHDLSKIRKEYQELGFNRFDISFIAKQIQQIEDELDTVIPVPYDINIFTHLYILIERTKKGQFTEQLSEELVNSEGDWIQEKRIYLVAKSVIKNIEDYLNITVSTSEVYYLYQYLVSSRIDYNSSMNAQYSKKVIDVTEYYLEHVTQELHIPNKSTQFFNELANHIKPMINRLKNDIYIENSLLDQIKLSYPQIFSAVKKVSQEVSDTFSLRKIDDNENGFICLYFARVLEDNKERIKTIIMCTTGIGTSELLRVKVENNFPEIEVIDVVSERVLKQRFKDSRTAIDLLLTTIKTDSIPGVRTLLVSSLLNSEDKFRIREVISEIYESKF
ncbi:MULTISPECIES: BglG family transcription antiterminator [Aerococcus]|uniref:BglG family transcription antiterminator n=1 Tax=Aerococcus TaxID=1375 RepID=UPI0015EC652D|nr:PRD domain-containing protein [Aerococcus urinae]MDK6597484.1 PRD domain-containing protein [Aerococcus urinae]